MSSENVCDFCLNPIDSNYQIKELRRKLDVAIIALECIADRPDPTKDEMLLVKFAQEALARYRELVEGKK